MTERKIVVGMVSDGYKVVPTPIVVRFTSDQYGESLSLTYNDDFMIQVNFGDVVPMIEKARAEK